MPAKLSARARLFDTGHNPRATHGAHAVAAVAMRTAALRVLTYDLELKALRTLVDSRGEVTRAGVQTVKRLHLLSKLLRGHAKDHITIGQAKRLLAMRITLR